jgi:hypothetical protein
MKILLAGVAALSVLSALAAQASDRSCDVERTICEGEVLGTGKGIIVDDCNFLHESQLNKGCTPGSSCYVKSIMNDVLNVCPYESRCHIELEYPSNKLCYIKRISE